MVTKRRIAIFLALVAVLQSSPSQAHVLIRDSSGQIGAVLHITPADDPVAGEVSDIYLAIQSNEFSPQTHSYVLIIFDSDGVQDSAPAFADDKGVSAQYIFPKQGVYELRFIIRRYKDAQVTTFSIAQRVSRGLQGAGEREVPEYAEVGIVAAASGLLSLSIIAFNRRRRIAEYSK